mmetsp:Transcript_7745/g.22358  ORF Transcript_7745/g.22358 Transcript_7745/m.22358 type:complete len:238 (-) Transcript_7745:847-1560(-)
MPVSSVDSDDASMERSRSAMLASSCTPARLRIFFASLRRSCRADDSDPRMPSSPLCWLAIVLAAIDGRDDTDSVCSLSFSYSPTVLRLSFDVLPADEEAVSCASSGTDKTRGAFGFSSWGYMRLMLSSCSRIVNLSLKASRCPWCHCQKRTHPSKTLRSSFALLLGKKPFSASTLRRVRRYSSRVRFFHSFSMAAFLMSMAFSSWHCSSRAYICRRSRAMISARLARMSTCSLKNIA